MNNFHISKDYKTLTNLGLDDKEALIYLSSLEIGGGTISDLAKTANLERTGIYYHIQKLLDLKLLKMTERGKRTVYLPGDPKRLKKIADDHQKQLANLLPMIQESYSRQTSRSIIEYYQGKEEINKFYDRVYDLLKTLTPPDNHIYVLGTSNRTVTQTNKEFLNYERPPLQLDIVMKAILPISQKSKMSKENLADPYIVTRYNLPPANLRYIEDKYAYPASVNIFYNYIVLYDYQNMIYSITENKNLAITWRMFFEFIWDHLPKS